ncbi:hypothetical protein BH09ACT7_BH09ACT7_08370 [soil metagenome]
MPEMTIDTRDTETDSHPPVEADLDDTAEYTLAAGIFFHKKPGQGPRTHSGDGTRYVRGDQIRLTANEARRLLRCGAVVPIGTPLSPEPATVSYGDGEPLRFDEHSQRAIDEEVARGVLRPATGPHIFVR